MDGITTSELARRGGINLESIRFYERQGLLPKPPRTASGYRMFPAESIRRVRFIKRAQELGFSLKEIKELLALRLDPDTSCADVRRQADEKLAGIDQKLHDLRRMKQALARLAATCPGRGATSDCPILGSLETDEPRTTVRAVGDVDGRAKPSARPPTTDRRR